MDYREYCYVMDYSDESINEICIDKEDKDLDTESFLDKYGFDSDACVIMYTTHRITDIFVCNKS